MTFDDYFVDIDSTLVDLIWFPQDKDRDKYLELINDELNQLGISQSTLRNDAVGKVVGSNTCFPFLLESMLFKTDFPFSTRTTCNRYFTLCKICQFNLKGKLEVKINNFINEELLFAEALSCEMYNYARINTAFKFGETYAIFGDDQKRDKYFKLIMNDKYELSPATITGFYKLIAEIYNSAGDYQNSLKWLKLGLIINPKFSVKRLIKQLESKT
ncbi:MAG: hypothetical protein J0M30_07035 [Chitinophagales bacterium]|nr:hypothetical protein [Chitinophagales bacterium]